MTGDQAERLIRLSKPVVGSEAEWSEVVSEIRRAPQFIDVVEVFEGKDGWRVRLSANNGETVFVGESYGAKSGALRAAAAAAGQLGVPLAVEGQ
jgi:hypothetical protein